MGHTTIEHVSGQLLEQEEGKIVLGLPHSDYQLHLAVTSRLEPSFTGTVQGTIHARARRVDKTQNGRGGCYIEPVYGRPRRVQGRVVQIDLKANTLTVQAACPICCTLVTDQSVADFELQDFVTFDVEPGARFMPLT